MSLEEQMDFLGNLNKGDVFIAEYIHGKNEFRIVEWDGKVGKDEYGLFVEKARVVVKTEEMETYMVSDVLFLDDDFRKPTAAESVLFRLLKNCGKNLIDNN